MDKRNGSIGNGGVVEDDELLLKDHDGEEEAESLILTNGHQYYTLPTFRYKNIFICLVFVDAIVSIVLWLTGGHTDYFVDNVIHFHMRESVFDLALMATVKVITIVTVLPYLEFISNKKLDKPFDTRLRKVAKYLHILLIMLGIVFLAYSATKGGLILNSLVNDSTYKRMHATYNALVISAVCFSLIECVFAVLSVSAMKRLKTVRIVHRFNDKGQEVDKDGNPIPKQVNFKRLLKLAKPEAPLIIAATFALFASSASSMVAPLFFGMVVDAAQRSMEDLTRTVLIMLGIYIGGALFSMMRAWLFCLAGQRLVARLRKQLFGSIIQQEIAFFDTNRTGELCNRLASDTQVLQNAATVNMSMLSRYILQLIGSLALMFYLNAALTGVLLAVVPVVALLAVQYGKYMKNLRKEFQDRLGDAGTTAEESLSSIRTVRSFSAENKSCSLYGKDVDKSYHVGKKLAAAEGIFNGTVGILAYGAIALVLWYGGKLVYEHSQDASQGVSPGILTAFLLYTLQVAMAFALMSSLYGEFMQALGASVRIFALLDRKPEVPNENGVVLGLVDGRVDFKDVKFTYPSRPETEVLKDISFTVQPGEMVALVGPSGGGKSTIVNLIERFYDPDSGMILLGGSNLTSLDPQWFRKKVAMVSQEPTLFACSIKDNIAYGKVATMEEIESAAKQANAHNFIMSFEAGYDTLVGERGVRLSGGQKQRIAIARALIMDPVLLLLDEATSALDAESEHLVQEAIDRAMNGRTVIVIAHRLSTVRNASKVIVIDKGSIAELGDHEELIAKAGVYKRLVLRQLNAGLVTDGDKSNGDPDVDYSLNASVEVGDAALEFGVNVKVQ